MKHLKVFDGVYLDGDGFVLRYIDSGYGRYEIEYFSFTKTNMGTLVRTTESSTIFERYKLLEQCSE